MVTVRHGGYAEICYNTFQGNNGIRLLGYGNRAHHNLHKDNSASDKMGPYQIQNALKSKDPNWIDASKPSGKEGSIHATYVSGPDNEVYENEFVNCKNKIYYRKGEPLTPKNLKIDQPPSTPTPTPPEEPPEVVTPEPAEPEEIPQCSICHNEPATKKVTLSIYVGASHYESAKASLVELLKAMRAEAAQEVEAGGGGVQT